jgi:glycosyltransferase involved in cell wall biosynthesis
MKVYEAVDVMPSGHGHVGRGHIKSILNKEVELTVRTQQTGWNKNGDIFGDHPFLDSRFKNAVLTSGRLNEKHLIDSPEELQSRSDDFTSFLGNNRTARPHDCLIREFESDEDIWHAIGGMEFSTMAPSRDPDIATVMETDYNLNHVPHQWVEWSKEVDEVWVPNEWVYSAFEEAGYTENVEIVPYGIDFSYKPTDYDCTSCPANKHTQPRGGGHCLDDDTFTFFSVARWYHIKGVDVLIEAFLREFSGDEDVRLFLKTTSNNRFDMDGIGQTVQQFAQEIGVNNPPEIGIRTEMMSDQHLMDLYGLADTFAFPSRAECVGIAPMQAAHAGTPVVTNDWSSLGLYFDDDEAILIDDGETKHPESRVNWVPRKGGEWYPDEAEWFEPNIQAVQNAWRQAYEMDEGERNALGQRGQEMVHETFDWDDHIETRVERFEQLAE